MGVKAINTLREILNGFHFDNLLDILLSVIPALLCITLHELSHGLVAYALGDDTAKNEGRLTLNPLKHLDPMGLLMMVVFHFGYAKPVPVNMMKFKNPKRGMAVTALAGPASNFIIAVVFFFLTGFFFPKLSGSAAGGYVLDMLIITAQLSLMLCLFNLIPIPPLDGSKLLFSVLPNRAYWKLLHYERYGTILMIALVMLGALNGLLSAAENAVMNWLLPVLHLGVQLGGKVFGLT